MANTKRPHACPISRDALLDRTFLEHRAKLLDLAAFLDRCERAAAQDEGEDFRLVALRQAMACLTDGQPHRTRRILERLSDPSAALLDHAPAQSAAGAAPKS